MSAPPSLPQLLIGVALAGGRSRRMGRDKAALRLDGVSLLAHTVRRLAGVCDEVWVSGREVSGDPEFLSLRSIPDQQPGAGPLAAMDSCLAALDVRLLTKRRVCLCFLPVDVPRFDGMAIRRLFAPLLEEAGEVVSCADSPLPLALRAMPSTCARVHAVAAAAEHRGAVGALLKTLDYVALPSDPDWARALQNLNTPDDWMLFNQRSGD